LTLQREVPQVGGRLLPGPAVPPCLLCDCSSCGLSYHVSTQRPVKPTT